MTLPDNFFDELLSLGKKTENSIFVIRRPDGQCLRKEGRAVSWAAEAHAWYFTSESEAAGVLTRIRSGRLDGADVSQVVKL